MNQVFRGENRSLIARQGASRSQIRVVLLAGFGGLLLLLGVLGFSAMSFLGSIRNREEKIRQDYVVRDEVLRQLRSEIYLSGTYIRDFLLDSDDAAAGRQRQLFVDTRNRIGQATAQYNTLLRQDERDAFRQLSGELAAYMSAIDPVLSWNAGQRRAGALAFMQDELLPRRMSALALADRIQQISEAQLESGSASVSVMLASFRVKLLILLILTIVGGISLAGTSLWRLLRLEDESQARFAEVLSTREELQRLSSELVQAQESERRRLSRELHDEVGQVLSAIMLGLGNLRSAVKEGNAEEAARQLDLVEDMTQRNASVVRNISLLLRPTMLDDLGLVPALRWLAREVSRSGSMVVEVAAEPFTDDLPEEHRTCVFRIVQEAVRNAARHADAAQVRILLMERDGSLILSIQDDGKGFDPAQEAGMGILGMRERVARLQGTLEVKSRPGSGTLLSIALPLRYGHQEINPLRTA